MDPAREAVVWPLRIAMHSKIFNKSHYIRYDNQNIIVKYFYIFNYFPSLSSLFRTVTRKNVKLSYEIYLVYYIVRFWQRRQFSLILNPKSCEVSFEMRMENPLYNAVDSRSSRDGMTKVLERSYVRMTLEERRKE